MTAEGSVLLALDLLGTFAFALNGALTALRVARLDIVGVVTLGMVTALGGGIIRDLLIGAVPPATFSDWRYLAVATAGGLVAFAVGRQLERLTLPINLLDAAGLSLFAVTGASKALDFGLGAVQAVILGAVTAVGGGTLRDVLVRPMTPTHRAPAPRAARAFPVTARSERRVRSRPRAPRPAAPPSPRHPRR